MATQVITPAPKVSWFKRTCAFIAKVLKVAVVDEQKIAPILVPALEGAFPEFAPLIAGGDAIATKIVKQIIVTQTMGSAIAGAPNSVDKLNAAVEGIEPEIDAWTAAAFPGSVKLSQLAKSGIVQAFYNALQEIEPGVASPALPPASAVTEASGSH